MCDGKSGSEKDECIQVLSWYEGEVTKCNSKSGSEKAACLSTLEGYKTRYSNCGNDKACITVLKDEIFSSQKESVITSQCAGQTTQEGREACEKNIQEVLTAQENCKKLADSVEQNKCLARVDSFVNAYQACSDDTCRSNLTNAKNLIDAEQKKCDALSSASEKASCNAKIDSVISKYMNCKTNSCRDDVLNSVAQYQQAIEDCNKKSTKEEQDSCRASVDAYVEGKSQCDGKTNAKEKQVCIAGLEYAVATTSCSYTDASKKALKIACDKKSGYTWNCLAGACIPVAQDNQLRDAYVKCQLKETKELRDNCVKDIEGTLKGLLGVSSDLKSSLGDGAKIAAAATSAAVVQGLTTAFTAFTMSNGKGGFCKSSMTVTAAGVLALMSEKTTSEKAKKEIENLKKEFYALQSTLDTYEGQVRALQFLIASYRKIASIVDMKAKAYGQSAQMYGLATLYATYEMMQPPPAPCKSAAMNAMIAGAIGMGLSMKLQSTMKGIADNLRSRAQKTEYILQKLMELFSPTDMDISALAQNGNEASVDQNKLSILSDTGNMGVDDLDETISVSCINSSGTVDEKCACQKTNSCASISTTDLENDFKKMGSVGLSFANATKSLYGGKDGAVVSFNNLAKGKVNLGSGGLTSDSKLAAIKKLTTDVAKKANSSNKRKGPDTINVDFSDKLINDFVTKNKDKKILAGKGTASLNDNSNIAGILNELKDVQKTSAKEIKDNSDVKMQKIVEGYQSFDLGDGDFSESNSISSSLGDELDDGFAKNSLEDTKALKEYEYDYDNEDINITKNPDANIWKVITNRYMKVIPRLQSR